MSDASCDIDFLAAGGRMTVTCSEHGIVYEGMDPYNPVGRKNLVSAQSARHRKEKNDG